MPDEGESQKIEAPTLRVPVEIDTSEADRQSEEFKQKFRDSIEDAMREGMKSALVGAVEEVSRTLAAGLADAVREGMKIDDFTDSVRSQLGDALRSAMEEATKTKVEVLDEGGDGQAGTAVLRDNPLVEAIRKQTDAIETAVERMDMILDALENPSRGR